MGSVVPLETRQRTHNALIRLRTAATLSAARKLSGRRSSRLARPRICLILLKKRSIRVLWR